MNYYLFVCLLKNEDKRPFFRVYYLDVREFCTAFIKRNTIVKYNNMQHRYRRSVFNIFP